MDPEFWSHAQRAELIMKEIKTAKNWMESFNKAQNLMDDLEVLLEFLMQEKLQKRN